MTLTQYWPWYRQRLWRCVTSQILLSPLYVKHVDRMADFHESLGHWSHLYNPRTCAIGPEMITHLPHQVLGIWPQGMDNNGLMMRLPKLDSKQETWCAQQFGLIDREWLYLGNGTWAFRTQEHATQFQLVWL